MSATKKSQQNSNAKRKLTDGEPVKTKKGKVGEAVVVDEEETRLKADEEEKWSQIECPKFGQMVNRREFRRAGPYLIGIKLGHSPVDSIVQYLAKKENSNQFVQLKVSLKLIPSFR